MSYLDIYNITVEDKMKWSLHSESVVIQFPLLKLSSVFGQTEVSLLVDSTCCFKSLDIIRWLAIEDVSDNGESAEAVEQLPLSHVKLIFL